MASDLPLGRQTSYPRVYAPSLLAPIPRAVGREALGLGGAPPFDGVDVWNAYELSWLDARGKPVVATAELWVPATSPRIVESKSLKLYLNSLNATHHDDPSGVADLIRSDVERVVGADVLLRIRLGEDFGPATIGRAPGTSLDGAELTIDTYAVDAGLLAGSADARSQVEETLHSQLLKSNCPVTGQPDWATLVIHYRGGRIDRDALLRYVVSYRDHDEFHEQCVERIFTDIKRQCLPDALTVWARYTRRGGLDINPFRSDFETLEHNQRLWRQ